MYKKILVPLDGSPLAESVLEHVRSIAKCTGAEVVLLRVVTLPVSAYMLATDPHFVVNTSDDMQARALEYLNDVAAGLRKEGIPVAIKICSGVVSDTIQELAALMQVDLIAMSTHGRGGLARWVIGSVADQLVRNAKTPILLIRPSPKANARN